MSDETSRAHHLLSRLFHHARAGGLDTHQQHGGSAGHASRQAGAGAEIAHGRVLKGWRLAGRGRRRRLDVIGGHVGGLGNDNNRAVLVRCGTRLGGQSGAGRPGCRRRPGSG